MPWRNQPITFSDRRSTISSNRWFLSLSPEALLLSHSASRWFMPFFLSRFVLVGDYRAVCIPLVEVVAIKIFDSERNNSDLISERVVNLEALQKIAGSGQLDWRVLSSSLEVSLKSRG
ncbi:uncharacterized protein LOC120250707 isoform X2 [Dioscorea cayenensis subsp. rotundata]|uniref:Uncharacterized protein LOC120250707 isoform X2 n=1 Tax=Dioscorea cayennensis subsp. rotundata TaxID=55577 RepID=A0AB40AKV3_DIOCR|nr:uncharacterized protein LOC120250707 isoform X2 [Dioscorea cayenensis subsp. rotundata]